MVISGYGNQSTSQCPVGLGTGSPALVDLGHRASGKSGFLSWLHSWDNLLPSSVLGARQAQRPPDVIRAGLLSDGEEVGRCPGHDEPGRRAPKRHSQG